MDLQGRPCPMTKFLKRCCMRKWITACLVGTIWLILGIVVWVVASPCSHPLDQETAAVITSLRDNDVLRGRIEIIGWADDPDFWRYELHFAHEPVEGNWVSVEGIVYHQPVINRRLGRWDTTLVPNGRYRLRLRVVRRDGNYQDVYANGLRVANGLPTEARTPRPTSTPRPTRTSVSTEESKGGLGMDYYVVRTWLGWHHHVTECLLAHHFLVRTQMRLKRRHLHSPSGRLVCWWSRSCPSNSSHPKRRWHVSASFRG